ncbi:MAG: choice-of-anchor D domain-containing protein, partial [Casimicrobium sp.]
MTLTDHLLERPHFRARCRQAQYRLTLLGKTRKTIADWMLTLFSIVFLAGLFAAETRAQPVPFAQPDLQLAQQSDREFTSTTGGEQAQIYAIAKQPDGKVLVGGRFNQTISSGGAIADQPYSGLLRLNADGSIDTTFNVYVSSTAGRRTGEVHAIAVAADGIYISGDFTEVAPAREAYPRPNPTTQITRNSVAKLDLATGAPIADWNAVLTGSTGGQPIKGLAVAGNFVYVGGIYGNSSVPRNLTRYSTSTGELDATWTPNPDAGINGLTARGNRLFVAGQFANIAGQARKSFALFDVSGSAPTLAAFSVLNQNSSAQGNAFALSPDGNTLFASGSFEVTGTSVRGVAKFDLAGTGIDGTPDATWIPGLNQLFALDLAGRDLYVAGSFGAGASVNVARVDAQGNGAVDATWKPEIDADATTWSALAIASSGDRVYIGGNMRRANDATPSAPVRRSGFASFKGRDVVQPTYTVAPLELDFGTKDIGTETLLDLTIAHAGPAGSGAITATSPLALSGGTAGSGVFDFETPANDPTRCFPLAEGATCTIKLKFKPAIAGEVTTTLQLATSGSGPTSVPLKGTGAQAATAQIQVTPPSHNYGDVSLGNTGTQTFTVKNVGTADLTLSGYVLEPANAVFAIVTPASGGCTVGIVLTANAECTIQGTFTPTAAGAQTTAIRISNNAANATAGATDVALSGNGVSVAVPTLEVSPLSLAFGEVTVNQNRTLEVTLRNTSTVEVNSIAATFAASGVAFSRVAPTSAGATDCGAVLAASATCVIAVQFAPTAVFAYAGSMSIASNATGSPVEVSLSGRGVQQVVGPNISVTPSSHDYGNTTIGASKSQQFTVSNTGDAALSITSFSIVTAGDFTWSSFGANGCGATQTLQPAASCVVEVLFNPAT